MSYLMKDSFIKVNLKNSVLRHKIISTFDDDILKKMQINLLYYCFTSTCYNKCDKKQYLKAVQLDVLKSTRDTKILTNDVKTSGVNFQYLHISQ